MGKPLNKKNGLLRPILATFVILFVGLSCGLQGDTESDVNGQTIPYIQETDEGGSEVTSIMDDNSQAKLSIELSDGSAHPGEIQRITQGIGEPLSENQIEAILSRLPALTGDIEDQTDFHLPEASLPPPRTGETIEESFPPLPSDEMPVVDDYGPLEVIRYSPEGEIPIAPFVNITFNQPMVPLTTLGDLENEVIPVQIEPGLQGTWRWLGTKTLNFQYDSDLIDRLPMATKFTVTIPSGTLSEVGGKLKESVQFTFSTPPPTLQRYYPSYDPQPLDPVFFVSFDQRINSDGVLDSIKVTADGELIKIRKASSDEINNDKRVNSLVENSMDERWLAFKSVEELPSDSGINITIGPGTPSAEGSQVTTEAQSYSFRTYAPLQIVEHGCSWGWDECRPLEPFYIRFNNPIDPEHYEDSMLRIDPELQGAFVNVAGRTLQIRGASQGQTTYSAVVSRRIKDIFGQTLGKDSTLKFKVGNSEPVLTGPDDIFVTLDPTSKKPVLSLFTINYTKLDLKVYEVQPDDWSAFNTYLQEYQRTDKKLKPPGKLVLDEIKRLETPSNSLTEIGIDLSEVMDGDFGHFIVIAKPPKGLFQEDRYWEAVQVWVQVTQIGLDAFADHSEMIVWANNLSDGSPISEINIESGSGEILGETRADGLTQFDIPSNGIPYLVARKGKDTAFLPPSTNYWGNESWSKRSKNDTLVWYVLDDRQMYRPGEEVHIKGWTRLVGGKQDGNVGLIGNGLRNINYQIIGPQGNVFIEDQISVNPLGGFDFSFSLPENSNLGYARIELGAVGNLGNIDGTWYTHSFQIQEFRRPEFEVSARNETSGPYFVDESATVAVEAKYYAGGPLPNADVSWYITSSPTNYSPPNWPDFTFGTWQPWWWGFYGDSGEQQFSSFEGKTDATGNHYLNLDFEEAQGFRPFSIMAEGTVMDINRQAWTGSTSLLVHPASLYVGLKSDRYFVERGTPLMIDLVVTDLEGNPLEDNLIMVTAARLEWKYSRRNWSEEEVEVQECKVASSLEPVSCTFETPIGGRYQITAIITDEHGRSNQSRFTRWVSGGEQPPSREVEKEQVTLVPDKENYQPGDIAQILVQSPFVPAEGLLTVSRSGILYTERFKIDDGSITLEIPIEDAHIPNVNIQVDLVGSSARTDDDGKILPQVPERPAYASGNLIINVPPLSRTLNLELKPKVTALEPGGETSLEVILTDSNHLPISDAELVVVVVDEAILALTNYILTDPVSVFYRTRSSDLNSYYGRASIILADPEALADAVENAKLMADQATMVVEEGEMVLEMAMEAPAAEPSSKEMTGFGQTGSEPIRVRSDFNPLATFSPEVRTDQSGRAVIEIKVPDNLTRYRIMVLAVDPSGSKFGSAETNLTARLPLMVRPSAPRFLNFGDDFEMPIVLQNQTDDQMEVDVVVQVSNLELSMDSGYRVLVPANDRIEVRFPANTIMAGTARFQVAAISGGYSDAASGVLPVYTPATSEAFATYGIIDDGAAIQPIGTPSDVFPQFGGLEIQTSSTALQALTDAVIYLVSYPYECSEQLSSRILGVAALRDVLTAFDAEGLPSPEAMEAAVDRDIDRLRGLQNWDGGWPYWRRGQDSIPFNTIHTAHALQRASSKGFSVPPEMQQQVLPYLRDIETHYPYWYSQRTRQTLSAYALFVRDLMGDSDQDKARRLLTDEGIENLTLDAIGWIWAVLVDDHNSVKELDSIRKYINNKVVETPSSANFVTRFDDQTYLLLSSNRRTDAILLDSLIADDPDNYLIPKLVSGLLAHRVKGRWSNTQENIFVLLALDRYFNVYETQTPNFVAQIWLGDTYAGEHSFEGRTTERHETQIPMAYLFESDDRDTDSQNLIINKEGPGRLYYRLGLKYAPTDLWLDPLDMGFVVQRIYEAVDDPDDVSRDEDGIWQIKAGSRVRVRVTMVADNRRYHVALVDPLPAGLEIMNPALAVTGSTPQDPNSDEFRHGWWWYWPWYEHQNMRDERAEAFTPLLWDGVYEFTYIAKATTPGTFVVPPAKAEEMYSPEVFGRSASDWVVIE